MYAKKHTNCIFFDKKKRFSLKISFWWFDDAFCRGSFNQYKVKIRKRNSPHNAWRNKYNRSFIVGFEMPFLTKYWTGKIVIIAMIKEQALAKKIGKSTIIIFPTTTELPTIIIDRASSR